MNEEQARAILGESVEPDGSLFNLGQLEAIAWWMRNMDAEYGGGNP
jgi:hypothetical protein